MELIPSFEGFEAQYGDKIKFTKLNIADARRVAIGQKVLGLPTVAVYSGGEKVQEITKSEVSAESIEEMIKAHI